MTEQQTKGEGRVKPTYGSRRIARIGKRTAFFLFALAVALVASKMVYGGNAGQVSIDQHQPVMGQGG